MHERRLGIVHTRRDLTLFSTQGVLLPLSRHARFVAAHGYFPPSSASSSAACVTEGERREESDKMKDDVNDEETAKQKNSGTKNDVKQNAEKGKAIQEKNDTEISQDCPAEQLIQIYVSYFPPFTCAFHKQLINLLCSALAYLQILICNQKGLICIYNFK